MDPSEEAKIDATHTRRFGVGMDVAFIGAGKMASTLLQQVDELPDVNVAAICDVDEGAAAEAAVPRDAAVFTDHQTMFEESDFAALFVAIPPFAYDDQPELAAEHGVDLFMEKPVGLRPEYAHEMARHLSDSDVITAAGYVFRYDEITEKASELIDGRTVGMLDGRYWSGLPASRWGYEMETSGGVINVNTTHLIDLLRYFADEPARVYAAGSSRIDREEIDYDDEITAIVEHETDVVSHVSASTTAPNWTVELDVIGDDFELHLDFTAQTLTGTVDGEDVEFDGECNRYRREVETFVEACRQRDQELVRSSYADAARTLDLNWAIIDAIDADGPVEVR